jgi:hypothetical protein
MFLLLVDLIAWLAVLALVLSPVMWPRPRPRVVERITAAGEHVTLALGAAGGVTASAASRTLSGVVVKYGIPGHTNRGRLKVAPGALTFPADLGTVKLTREHVREESRGHLVDVVFEPEGIRASLKVSDGPEGDTALREAQDRTRDGLSFDIVDALIVGDTITSGRVVAIGQVGIPAYEDGRIDSIAAANQEGTPVLTKDERARLNELRAKKDRTADEANELNMLAAKAGGPDAGEGFVSVPQTSAAPANGSSTSGQQASPQAAADAPASQSGTEQVAASMQSVPGGAEGGAGGAGSSSSTSAKPRGGAYGAFLEDMVEGLRARANGDKEGGLATITAALSDITNTSHKSIINPPDWSGELWSGQEYVPEFADLFNSGDLTSWKGQGWRFTTKFAGSDLGGDGMPDYAGDKAAISSATVATESDTYEAARMAIGVDIDRKFFDFPQDINAGFVDALFSQAREGWAISLDAKVKAYVLAQAQAALVDETDTDSDEIDPQTTLLRACAIAIRALKRRRCGTASWIYVNDDDYLSLIDVTNNTAPAWLDLFGVDPKNVRNSDQITAGTVVAGVKAAANVKTLPGSPIRVEAQNLTNAGVDEAFFGYYAIQKHHKRGIASASFDPDFDPDAET